MADHDSKSGGGGGNSAEDFFFFLLFVFLLVAWVINGGLGGGSTAQNTDLTVGPGQLLSSPRDESERTQKKWYEFLKIATSSDE